MERPRLRFVRPANSAQPATPSAPATQLPPAPQPEHRGLIAHAAWVPPLGMGSHQLALWMEKETESSARRRRASDPSPESAAHVRPHPFTARHSQLLSALERLWKTSRPGLRPRTSCTPVRLLLWLPALGTRPLPSPELVRAGWAPDPALQGDDLEAAHLTLWRADALFLDAETAGTLLAGLPHHAGAEAAAGTGTTGYYGGMPSQTRLLLGSDLRLWSAAAKLVLDLLVRQRYLPGVMQQPETTYYGVSGLGPQLTGLWFAALSDPQDHARFDALVAAMPDLCRAAVTPGITEPSPEAVPTARALIEDFAHCVVNARVAKWIGHGQMILDTGGNARDPFNRYSYGSSYYGYGHAGSLTQRWLWGLMDTNRPIYTTPDESRALLEGIERWHAGLSGAGAATFRLCLRLSPPDTPEDEARRSEGAGVSGDDLADGNSLARDESRDAAALKMPRLVAEPSNAAVGNGHHAAGPGPGDGVASALDILGSLDDTGAWRLDYLLQARDDLSLLVPLEDVWRERGATARFLDRRFDHPHERVLASLGQAARLFEPIDRSLRQAHPLGCDLSGAEAYAFLREAVPLLEEAGFGVHVPAWWKRAAARPTVRLKLRGVQKTNTGLMGLDAVVGYDWKLALGGEELTREELERLAALKEPLVRLRGKWVELQPDQVEAALRFVRAHPTGKMSLGEALRASLTGEVGDGEVAIEEVRADEWIGELLGRLRSGEALAEVAPPEGLHGTLRPYQVRGLGWLDFLTRYGLGACLADDMGLGKTLEFLALMLHQKAQGRLGKPVLLVCPTSVVGNWRHETARFAPELRVLVHHGAGRVGRAAAESFAAEVAGYDLVVTTYSLLPRDEETLATADWGAVVLDEAQNIKNAEAKQSRAARKLKAPVRVALTGTPVENRLAELWSIMDFLNGGYLGSNKRFHERFATPIEKLRDQQATAQLQALVRPFVLRRLKTDPTVISDLPEKLEMREYCPLTREQVTLYEAVVRDGLRQLEAAAEPMQRRGVVLAILSRLKQVCNHPAHFLGDGSSLADRSGKLTRLEELIEELLDDGDRALIFTQFTAMGDRLQPYLQERFGTEVLYLHGAVPQQQRERLVARFQAEDGPPLFLLSLKAGGTGLNLTRANHVIHFDRWWNPAVENQATDRAFRIGQTCNVQVRKFVCTGTLEERIDAMIEQKRELAEKVIGTGEGWLTEMSTAELHDLFTLRAEALAD
jgi:SNF2 family DNA or RNA helicase